MKFGKNLVVNAEVKTMHAYSAHGDYQEMSAYLSCQDPLKVKEIFLVHGKCDVQQSYREKLEAIGFKNIRIPAKDSEYLV
jgi:metallo-beta-lactamase family protein